MSEEPYKFDVAISFLSQDEPLAIQLKDKLVGLETFVYSRAQEHIANADGLETFRQVFRHNSRVQLVLYRAGWGGTDWTAVEEAAIEGRCLKNRYQNLMLVNIDGFQLPAWVPETFIDFRLDKYSLDKLAGNVKRRVEAQGGTIEPQTQLHRGKRLADRQTFERETWEYFSSHEGVLESDAKLAEVFDLLDESFGEMELRGMEVARSQAQYVIRAGTMCLHVLWKRPVNSINGCEVLVRSFSGHLYLIEEPKRSIETPTELTRLSFEVDRSPKSGFGWTNGDEFFSVRGFSERIQQLFLDYYERYGRDDGRPFATWD